MAQKKQKVGNFEMKDYAASKPTAIGLDGQFIYPETLAKKKDLALGSLYALSEDLQLKLALERTNLEPDFKLGIIGVGILSKDDVIEQITNKTELGMDIVRAEMAYCNEFNSTLAAGTPPETWAEEPAELEREELPEELEDIPKKLRPLFRAIALFCENTTDSVTKLAAQYRMEKVHPVFAKRGFEVICLKGIQDVRYYFRQKALNSRTVYISGVGHGSPTTYTGHLGDPILRVGSYDPAEVKGKCMHLLSCQTAKELGPDVVAKGTRAYAGYFENFTFVLDDPSTPINELNLFWKCDSTFDIKMAEGVTAKAAHYGMIAAYNAAIAMVPNTEAAVWLTHDRNYLRTPTIDAIYGKISARIYPFAIPTTS